MELWRTALLPPPGSVSGAMAEHVDDDPGGNSSAQVSWLGLRESPALGSSMTDKGCRQHVLFYWALKALNTEKGQMWTRWHLRMDVSEKSHNQQLDTELGRRAAWVEVGYQWAAGLGGQNYALLRTKSFMFLPDLRTI